MYYTVACAGAVFLFAWALARVYNRRARACFAALPGYPALPLLGNMLKLRGTEEAHYHFIEDLSEKIEEHQKPFAFWAGPLPVLVVCDPEDVKLVTNAYIEKPYYYNFTHIWIGDGLITASGTIWKRNIKKLAGTFIGPIVDGHQGVFNAQAQNLLDDLKREVGGAPFDMQKILAFATLESICQTALGCPTSDKLVSTEYYEACTKTLKLLAKRTFDLFMHPEWVYQMTPAHRELVKCVEILHNVSNTVIANRRRKLNEMKQNGTYEEYKSENGRTKFRSFLDILLELSEGDPSMTGEQIRAEVDTIIVAGQETNASTLLYTILVVGSYPHVQEKMYAELQSIFGDSRRPVEKEDLVRMTYCEAVICEVLRLYPPMPLVMREATHDLKLKCCTIPKGTTCLVNVLGAGRSCRSWGADAREFRPERWLDGCSAPTAAFLPFSYGRRSCIGKKYAMALLKTFLAHCLRELEFVSEMKKLRFKYDITLKPASGHFVQVRLRK